MDTSLSSKFKESFFFSKELFNTITKNSSEHAPFKNYNV